MPQQMVLPVATEGCDYTWTLQELQLKQKNKINESLKALFVSSFVLPHSGGGKKKINLDLETAYTLLEEFVPISISDFWSLHTLL